MSKGISKLQKQILGLLDGSIRHQVFNEGDALTTAELLEELQTSGTLNEEQNHKYAMFTIRRACRSLVARGILQGDCEPDFDNVGRRAATWSSVSKAKPADAAPEPAGKEKKQ
jgi:hypothetical protein